MVLYYHAQNVQVPGCRTYRNNMIPFLADIGCAVLLVGYLQMMSWHTSAYDQSEKIRCVLFQSILKQDMQWFDTHEIGELNTRLVE